MKLFRSLVVILFCFLFFQSPSQVHATTFRAGEQTIFSQNEVSEGSLFITGSTVRVQGQVNGDVFCAGQNVQIEGLVNGDVICAGQHVSVTGDVIGDIRVAGQMVTLQNKTLGNVSTAAQYLTVQKQASIAGELGFVSSTATIDGTVSKTLFGHGETLNVSGIIGRDVTVSSNTLVVLPSAVVNGNLDYTSQTSADISQQASIAGTIIKSQPPKSEVVAPKRNRSMVANNRSISGLPFIIFSSIVGGLLIVFLKKKTERLVNTMKQQPVMSIVRGMLLLFVLPIALVLLCITIIGIPLVLMSLPVIVIAYGIARVLVAIVVGSVIIERLWEVKKESFGWALVAGIIVLWAVLQIPIIGNLISMIMTVYGFGGLTYLYQPKK